MILGAEFQRHIWTRFSWFSVLVVPILLCFVLLLSYMSYLIQDEAREAQRLMSRAYPLYDADPHWSLRTLFVTVPVLLLSLYFLSIIECATSFTSELKNKTWDLQKISAIRPMHLVIGKLLGTSSYSWYIVAWVLPLLLYAYANMFEDKTSEFSTFNTGPIQPVLEYPDKTDVAFLALCIVVPAFFGQVVAAYCSLRNLRHNRSGTMTPIFMGMFTALAFHFGLKNIVDIKFYEGQQTGFLGGVSETVNWYGHSFSTDSFMLCTLLYLISVTAIALYRMTRKELNFPSYPFVWILFLASLCVYIIGYGESIQYTPEQGYVLDLSKAGLFIIPLVIFFAATWSNAWKVSDNMDMYLRFTTACKAKNLKKALETMPDWIPLSCITAVILVLWFTLYEWSANPQELNLEKGWSILGLSLMLFLIRDLVITHAFMLGKGFRRGGMLTVLYLLFVYIFIPTLVFFSLSMGGAAVGFDDLVQQDSSYKYLFATFYPSIQSGYYSYVVGFGPPLAQICIALAILWFVLAPNRAKNQVKKTSLAPV